jgi:hypothetical protein
MQIVPTLPRRPHKIKSAKFREPVVALSGAAPQVFYVVSDCAADDFQV